MKLKEIFNERHEEEDSEIKTKNTEIVKLQPKCKEKWVLFSIPRYIKQLIGIYVERIDPEYVKPWSFYIENRKRKNPEDLICKLTFRSYSGSFKTIYVLLGNIENILKNMNQNCPESTINEVTNRFYSERIEKIENINVTDDFNNVEFW